MLTRPMNLYFQEILSLNSEMVAKIQNIIIIIALDNAPYKMLHKLKSACFIRKTQLWTSAFSSVSQKSLDQQIQVRSLNSTGYSFQQLGPATAKALKSQSVLWLGTTIKIPTNSRFQSRPNTAETAEPLVQKATSLVRWIETFETLEH